MRYRPRLAPRPAMRHAHLRPPVFPSGRASPIIAIRLGSPILPAHRSAFYDATPNRPAWRVGERGGSGCLACSCYMISCRVICSAFSLYVSYSCYMSRILVISLAFLLYIWRFCYMSRILVISVHFMLYYFVGIMRLWAGVFN